MLKNTQIKINKTDLNVRNTKQKYKLKNNFN